MKSLKCFLLGHDWQVIESVPTPLVTGDFRVVVTEYRCCRCPDVKFEDESEIDIAQFPGGTKEWLFGKKT